MSMTKAELEDRVADLERENAELRGQLEAAGPVDAAAARRAAAPKQPSFGMSEGERADLELTGRAVSPFTGEIREGTPDDHTVSSRSSAAATEPAAAAAFEATDDPAVQQEDK